MTSQTSQISKLMSESREHKIKTRKGHYCGGPIPPEKRADSKFCHNSCKAHYWEENKGKKKPGATPQPMQEPVKPPLEQPLEGLRGVLENKTADDVTDVKKTTMQTATASVFATPTTQETQAYKDARSKLEKAEADLKRIENLIVTAKEKIAVLENERNQLKTKPKKRFVNRSVDMMDLDDSFWDEADGDLERNKRAIAIQHEISMLSGNKSKLEEMQITAKRIYEGVMDIKWKSQRK